MTDDVSRVVALAWGVAAAPQRGPKRELSPERIVETAIEIADAEGLAAVTMQRVAKSFDYSTMALYRYVSTKDELQSLMLDGAFSDRRPPVLTGDWRADLTIWLEWVAGVYRDHPWVLDIAPAMEYLLMPQHLRVADMALQALSPLPATQGELLALLTALSSYVRGIAGVTRDITAGARISADTIDLLREVISPATYPGVAPLIANGSYPGPDSEVTLDDFAIGREVWLAGIQAVLGDREAPPEPARTPPPETPAEQFARAEDELAAGIAARKAAQQRVKELEKHESHLRNRRDRAKEAAKAAAKLAAE